MAASEDQAQHVIVEHAGFRGLNGSGGVVQQFVRQFRLLVAKRGLAADPADRLVASDIAQPRARIGWRSAAGPTLQRDRKGILQRILREIEIADEADQRGQRPARLIAKYFFDVGRCHPRAVERMPSSRGYAKRRTRMCNCTSGNLEIPGSSSTPE